MCPFQPCTNRVPNAQSSGIVVSGRYAIHAPAPRAIQCVLTVSKQDTVSKHTNWSVSICKLGRVPTSTVAIVTLVTEAQAS